MKRLTSAAMALCLALSSHAQGWRINVDKGDELLGTASRTTEIYTTGDYHFEIEGEKGIWLLSKKIINTEISGRFNGCNITVGLYDDNDKLLDKFSMWLDKDTFHQISTRRAGFMNNPVGQAKKLKKINSHLHSGSGYIRILVPIYEEGLKDLKIPYFSIKEEK